LAIRYAKSVRRSSLDACSRSYGAHGVSGARTAASTSSTARWTRLADVATQARTFPMHPKVLGTEVGLRQRVAAACNSRAGRQAESLDSHAVTPEQLVQIPCCAECGWSGGRMSRIALRLPHR
jgi:hypothetical protein